MRAVMVMVITILRENAVILRDWEGFTNSWPRLFISIYYLIWVIELLYHGLPLIYFNFF